MKVVALLKSFATKAGLTAEQIAEIEGIEALKELDIKDELASSLEKNLLSLAAAKTHPDVRAALEKTFKAELYNGLDAEINDVMTEIGLSDAQKADILAEKSSTKRASLLAKKVKEYEAAASKDSGTADKKELLAKVNDLNNNIAKLQREHDAALKAKDAELSEKLLQKEIEFDLLGYNYAFPEGTPAHIKLASANASISRRLTEKGVKVVVDNGIKKLVRLDGTDFYDEHNKAVSYKEFIDGALAQDSLLMASDPDKGDGGKTKYPPKVEGGKDDPKVNHSLVEAADADYANLMAANGQP
jgi:hypothetical protein